MGSKDDVEAIYFAYSRDVYHYLLSLCRNPDTAEDLLQNTFLQVIRGIAGFRGDCTIKSWIFTIARHEYYRWLKKHPPLEALDESFSYEQDIEGEYEQRERIKDALDYFNRCKEPIRSLMILRAINGLTFREIAAILEQTEVWARVSFMRNRCKMIEELKEDLR